MTASSLDTTLGDIAEIVSGATPKTSVEAYWDGGIPWATPKDLGELDGAFIESTPRTLSALGLKSCAATLLPAQSVLLSSRAPIGHVAINLVPMATNQGFKNLVPDTARVDSKFLYWWLRFRRPQLEAMGNGATFKEVSKKIVSGVRIQLPPLEEQRRIAVVLDAAEELHAKRRQTLNLLDSLTQAIFTDMFGNPLTNPKEIISAPLGDLIKLKSGQSLPAKAMRPGPHLVYGGNGVSGSHDEYMFEESRIVIGRVGVYCGCVHVTNPQSWITDNALYVYTMSPRLHPSYLAVALIQANLNQYASQAAQPLISGSRVYPVDILVPAKRDQDAFAQKLHSVANFRNLLERSSRAFETFFASLQQRAFRGEL